MIRLLDCIVQPGARTSVVRGQWMCATCKNKSPCAVPESNDTNIFKSTEETAATNSDWLSAIRREVQEVFSRTISVELQKIREELSVFKNITSSLEHLSGLIETVKQELDGVKKENQSLIKENSELRETLKNQTNTINILDRESRASNIELHCIPEKRSENLLKTVEQIGKITNVNIPEGSVVKCTRVAKINRNSLRPRSIIVKFNSPLIRDTFLAGVINFNKLNKKDRLNTSHLGVPGEKRPVFISEHLSSTAKDTYAAARIFAKQKQYRFVWTRNGKIFLRKTESSDAINVRGLKTKTKDVYLATLKSDFDVLVFTETWLNSGISDNELFDARYNIFRRDRESCDSKKKEGGGVLIAVLKKYKSYRVNSWETNCEDIWVNLVLESETISLCAVYIPSPLQYDILERFTINVERITNNKQSRTLVLGDFNIPSIEWSLDLNNNKMFPCNSGPVISLIKDFMGLTSLSQYNSVTNAYGKILDLIFSSNKRVEVTESNFSACSVDKFHPPLQIKLELEYKPSTLEVNTNVRYNFRKGDYEKINELLAGIDWETLLINCDNVDEMTEIFYSHLGNLVQQCIPKGQPKNNSNYPVWYTSNLKKRLREKNKCEYPALMTMNGCSFTNGSDICNQFAKHFSNIYATNDLKTTSSTPITRSMFNTHLNNTHILESDIVKELKSLDIAKGTGPDDIPPLFIKRCAVSLAKPLYVIFNKSLSLGEFPSLWKKARVVPIFKSGDKNDIKNYRPICLLSVFSKIFESFISPLLTWHMKSTMIDNQHGFTKKRSTMSNLAIFVDDISKAMDNSERIDCIYTDLEKAFDLVDHHILLQKLSDYGIDDYLLRWLESYLTGRTSNVVVGGYQSDAFTATSGVPQGSILGPILFGIFVNDIAKCFKHCEFQLYADDLKLYKTINDIKDARNMQMDVDRLGLWCDQNKLKLNHLKCYAITFSRKESNFIFDYNIKENVLKRLHQISDLGVTLDHKLTFIPHIDNIITNAFKVLGFIIRITKEFKKSSTKIALFNSLIRSKLEYCSVVWNPQYQTHRDRIERVQKKFLRHLAYKDKVLRQNDRYEDLLNLYHTPSLCNRRKLIDLCFLHRIVKGDLDSANLLERVGLAIPKYNSRSHIRNKHTFRERFARTNIGRNAPINRMILTYNNVFKGAGLDIFKHSLLPFKRLAKGYLTT
ncbi:uncharacterized protein LOC133319395 [Danaus plexippus]|uniref:uncharacterized protein LOC133319395 n=1 Tax=Danaus plexippus TaxID=13037 RepID=UPI002AB07C14|nr:uncharacterized protein LOC133319395 [Danaus plexippus]